jgi:class 3 adenylate cyclase
VRNPPLILIADDSADNVDVLRHRLERHYPVISAADGQETVEVAREQRPDLILLDVNMPKLNGFEVCRLLKTDPSLPFIPIIMVTARASSKDVVNGLDAGADEYLTKPVDPDALLARVRSMLRIKALQDTIREQSAQVDALNRRLRGFLSPQVYELIASSEGAGLELHRAEITVVFCDLRGYTAFTDRAQPEHLSKVLTDYHGALGPIIERHQGTLERFTGDGIMVFFNDPLPLANPEKQAVQMALAMRDAMRELTEGWQRWRNIRLGFGLGIDQGFANAGRIGFEGRYDYAAIGPVTNCSARVCSEAGDGQVLVTQPVYAAVETLVEAELVGDLELKGFYEPIRVYNVLRLK